MKSMDDLFDNVLQDVYYAEKQLLRTLPKLAKKSSNGELEKALPIIATRLKESDSSRFLR